MNKITVTFWVKSNSVTINTAIIPVMGAFVEIDVPGLPVDMKLSGVVDRIEFYYKAETTINVFLKVAIA